MRLERWVIPPAVAVAVFSTLAIVPLAGPRAEGLYVETVTGAAAVLVRVRVDIDGSLASHPPATVSAVIRDAHAGRHAAVARATPGAPFTFVTVPLAGRAYDGAVLDVRAEGRIARGALAPPPRAVATSLRLGAATEGEGGITLVSESGHLVPEVPERMMLRVVDGAGQTATVTPTDDSVSVSLARLTLDDCGIGAFETTVRGLDAHVVVRVGAREARRRIPVLAGGISLRRDDAALDATMPVGGSVAYVYAVDRFGEPLTWGPMRFDDPVDTNAHAHFTLPPDTAAAIVSLDPRFEHPVATTLLVAPEGCSRSVAGVRYAQAMALPVDPPRIQRWFNGAAAEGALREDRRRRVRRVSAVLAVVSLASLLALVLRAGLRGESRADVASLDRSARARALFVLAIAGALLLGGGLLLVVFTLRAS